MSSGQISGNQTPPTPPTPKVITKKVSDYVHSVEITCAASFTGTVSSVLVIYVHIGAFVYIFGFTTCFNSYFYF